MNTDIKNNVLLLLNTGKVSNILSGYVEDIKKIIEKSVPINEGEGLSKSSTINKIYSRRRENLQRQKISCHGLQETLDIVSKTDQLLKIIGFENSEYTTTIMINKDFSQIVGMFYFENN